jgi:Na+/phosphate symporter
MVLPEEMEKALERFRKVYGPGWEKKLIRLMEEEVRRKRAKKKLSIFLAKVSGRAKMSEEEVFQRLEGRP